MADKHSQNSDVTVVFPGTFDPPTEGHLEIIRRGGRMFTHLIVAVGRNPDKQHLFNADERVDMVRQLVADMPNVTVEAYEGLTIDFVRTHNASAILKGIRDTVDLRTELHQANTNRLIGDIETLFILTSDRHALTSSTLIKQVASMKGDISRLVPPLVAERLRQKFSQGNTVHIPQDDNDST